MTSKARGTFRKSWGFGLLFRLWLLALPLATTVAFSFGVFSRAWAFAWALALALGFDLGLVFGFVFRLGYGLWPCFAALAFFFSRLGLGFGFR